MGYKKPEHPANTLFKPPVVRRQKRTHTDWIMTIGLVIAAVGIGYLIIREFIKGGSGYGI